MVSAFLYNLSIFHSDHVAIVVKLQKCLPLLLNNC